MDRDLTLHETMAVNAQNPGGIVDILTNVKMVHRRAGEIIDVREGHNVVTNAGKAFVSGLICGESSIAGKYFENIGIGIGVAAAASIDTILGSEITTNGGGRTADATPTRATSASPAITNDTAVVDATFTFTGSFAVTESGLFDQTAVAGSTMLARQVFAALNVVSGDSLSVTWKITVSATIV